MADGDPAINLSADLDLVWETLLNCFQVVAARFTMRSEDYDRYIHLTRNLLAGATPYSEFRNQIRVLLQNYSYLTVYWEVYQHRRYTGTLLSVDYPLIIHPVNQCVHLNIIPRFVYERLVGYIVRFNRASGWSRADMNQVWDFLLNYFRDWCQGHVAWSIMRSEDYDRYTHLTRNLSSGVTPYSEFLPQMQVLLQNYGYLRAYWIVYHRWQCMETVELVDYLYPVGVCVHLNIIPEFVYVRLLGGAALRNRAGIEPRTGLPSGPPTP